MEEHSRLIAITNRHKPLLENYAKKALKIFRALIADNGTAAAIKRAAAISPSMSFKNALKLQLVLPEQHACFLLYVFSTVYI